MEKIIKGTELADKLLRVMEDGSLRIVETGKFVPKDGENYYYVNHRGYILNDNHPNEWTTKHSILFRTKRECMEYRAFLGLLDEYSSEFVEGRLNYYIYLNGISDVGMGYTTGHKCEGTYFDSEKKAQEFIDKVGKAKIKKFMFGIWD